MKVDKMLKELEVDHFIRTQKRMQAAMKVIFTKTERFLLHNQKTIYLDCDAKTEKTSSDGSCSISSASSAGSVKTVHLKDKGERGNFFPKLMKGIGSFELDDMNEQSQYSHMNSNPGIQGRASKMKLKTLNSGMTVEFGEDGDFGGIVGVLKQQSG